MVRRSHLHLLLALRPLKNNYITSKLFHNNQSFVLFSKSVNIIRNIIWVPAFDYYVHFVIVIELYCTRTICSIIVYLMVFVFSSQILSMQMFSILFVQNRWVQLFVIFCNSIRRKVRIRKFLLFTSRPNDLEEHGCIPVTHFTHVTETNLFSAYWTLAICVKKWCLFSSQAI